MNPKLPPILTTISNHQTSRSMSGIHQSTPVPRKCSKSHIKTSSIEVYNIFAMMSDTNENEDSDNAPPSKPIPRINTHSNNSSTPIPANDSSPRLSFNNVISELTQEIKYAIRDRKETEKKRMSREIAKRLSNSLQDLGISGAAVMIDFEPKNTQTMDNNNSTHQAPYIDDYEPEESSSMSSNNGIPRYGRQSSMGGTYLPKGVIEIANNDLLTIDNETFDHSTSVPSLPSQISSSSTSSSDDDDDEKYHRLSASSRMRSNSDPQKKITLNISISKKKKVSFGMNKIHHYDEEDNNNFNYKPNVTFAPIFDDIKSDDDDDDAILDYYDDNNDDSISSQMLADKIYQFDARTNQQPNEMPTPINIHLDEVIVNKRKSQGFLGINRLNFLQSLGFGDNVLEPKTPAPDNAEDKADFSDLVIEETVSTLDFDVEGWSDAPSFRSTSSDDGDFDQSLARSKKDHWRVEKRDRMRKSQKQKKIIKEEMKMTDKEKMEEIKLVMNKMASDTQHDVEIGSSSSDVNDAYIDIDDDDDEDGEYVYDDKPVMGRVKSRHSTPSMNDNSRMSHWKKLRLKEKGDRMWFKNHVSHLKYLRKLFTDMDKNGTGRIAYDDFVRFLKKHDIIKNFTESEIERFFIKMSSNLFDTENPNAMQRERIEISPLLSQPVMNKKKINPKKTSIFFKNKKTKPEKKIDLATFLFYFSSPIGKLDMELHDDRLYTANDEFDIDHIPDDSTADLRSRYSKAVVQAALEANKRNKVSFSDVDDSINTLHLASSSLIASARAISADMEVDDRDVTPLSLSLKQQQQRQSDSQIDKQISFALLSAPSHKISRSSSKIYPKRKTLHITLRKNSKRGSISKLKLYHDEKRKHLRAEDDINVGRTLQNLSAVLEQTRDTSIVSTESDADDDQLRLISGSKRISLASLSSSDRKYNYSSLVSTMKSKLILQNRTDSNHRVWNNCFVGRDAVTFFKNKEYVNSRYDGLLLGRKLKQLGFIIYAGKEERDFEDAIQFNYLFTDTTAMAVEITPALTAAAAVLHTIDNSSSIKKPFEVDNENDFTPLSSNSVSIKLQNTTPLPNSLSNMSSNIVEENSKSDNSSSSATLSQEFAYNALELKDIVNHMQSNIVRSTHRSITLSEKKNFFSGKEISNWIFDCKLLTNIRDKNDCILFGNYLRREGIIQHMEYKPIFVDSDLNFYLIYTNYMQHSSSLIRINTKQRNNNVNDRSISSTPTNSHSNLRMLNKYQQLPSSLMSSTKSSFDSIPPVYMQGRHTVANVAVVKSKKSVDKRGHHNKSRTAGGGNSSKSNRPQSARNSGSKKNSLPPGIVNRDSNGRKRKKRSSIILGQPVRKTFSSKKSRLKVEKNSEKNNLRELFSYIIRSQLAKRVDNMEHIPQSELLYMDSEVNYEYDDTRLTKIVRKIRGKFTRCDTKKRGALSKDEFSRFLAKCGICIRDEDFGIVFKIFDRNKTGFVDQATFMHQTLVKHVPGISIDYLTVIHLVKHTISVNFGTLQHTSGGDLYTRNALAITNAFEEINISGDGQITLEEFQKAYLKNGIDVYGGVTAIFKQLCTGNGEFISLEDFSEAFQASFYEHRTEAPTIKQVLMQAQLLRFAGQFDMFSDEEESVKVGRINTITDIIDTDVSNDYGGLYRRISTDGNTTDHIQNSPQNVHGGISAPPSMSADHRHGHQKDDQEIDILRRVAEDDSEMYDIRRPLISLQHQRKITDTDVTVRRPSITDVLPTSNSYVINGGVTLRLESGVTTDSMHINSSLHGDTNELQPLTSSIMASIENEQIIIDMNSPLVSIATAGEQPTEITTQSKAQPLQSSSGNSSPGSGRSIRSSTTEQLIEISLELSQSLEKVFNCFFLSTFWVALPGALVQIPLHFIQSYSAKIFSIDMPFTNVTWFLFGFLVYLTVQITMVGPTVTKSLFWIFVILFVVMTAIVILFLIITGALTDSDAGNSYTSVITWWIALFLLQGICECIARLKYANFFGKKRTKTSKIKYAIKHALGVTVFWTIQTLIATVLVIIEFSSQLRFLLIFYTIFTLTIIRNLTLNTFGTTFIQKLSDDFYLADRNLLDLNTDQMLLTQLSIMSSYASLWYLFIQTTQEDLPWVMTGIVLYQIVLLVIDWKMKDSVRDKMVSMLRGEFIAWMAVGIRAVLNLFYALDKPYIVSPALTHMFEPTYIMWNCLWIMAFFLGPMLILVLLLFRIHLLWSFEESEKYISDFVSTKEHMIRMGVICTFTMGFIASLTETASQLVTKVDI